MTIGSPSIKVKLPALSEVILFELEMSKKYQV